MITLNGQLNFWLALTLIDVNKFLLVSKDWNAYRFILRIYGRYMSQAGSCGDGIKTAIYWPVNSVYEERLTDSFGHTISPPDNDIAQT